MLWLNASLPIDIILGAIAAPEPAFPRPPRSSVVPAIVAAPAARARRRRQARRICSRPDVTFVAPLLPRLIVEPVRKRRGIRRVECPGDHGRRRRGWRTRRASGGLG